MAVFDAPTINRIWNLGSNQGTSLDLLEKGPQETLSLGMDFTDHIGDSTIGVSFGSITVDIDGLTIGTPEVSGQVARFFVSGGTKGQRYRVQVTLNGIGGLIFSGDGVLRIT